MAVTQAEIDQLESIKRSGTLTVTYEGRSITYRSMEELNLALVDMKAELALLEDTVPTAIRRVLFSTSDGIR